MKKILVPTDFSAYSNKAVRAAVKFAHAINAKIIFQHVIITPNKWQVLSNSKKPKSPESLKKTDEANKHMKALSIRLSLKKNRFTTCISYGIPHVEIVDTAKKEKVDLVIMGSHSHDKPERYYIGSVAQKVLRGANCPVLLIKNTVKSIMYKKVLVGVNLNFEANTEFKKINDLLKPLQSSVFLIFINSPSDFLDTRTATEKMDDFIKKYPSLKFHKVIYNHAEVTEGILQYTEDNPVGIIALLTHSRQKQPDYLIGNTEIIAFRSSIPVLSVNQLL